MLRMVARLPTLTPSSMGYFYSAALASRIDALLKRNRYDLIFVHCSSVAQYVSHVTGTPKILDFGDMDSQKWLEYAHYKRFPLSLGYRVEAAKLERAERGLAGRFDLCTATTYAEWQTLEGYRTGVATDWFPNGVDASYFQPSTKRTMPTRFRSSGAWTITPIRSACPTFARMSCRHCARDAPSWLLIVGADPTPAITRLGDLPGVTVTGSVPDVRPYLQRSALIVAPLNIARGTQNKILEAMACGVPVVTSAVAAGGVDAKADEHFLVAATPEQYIRAVLSVIDDPAVRARLAYAGRERMLNHHAWDHSMRRLDAIVERCLIQTRRSPLERVVAA